MPKPLPCTYLNSGAAWDQVNLATVLYGSGQLRSRWLGFAYPTSPCCGRTNAALPYLGFAPEGKMLKRNALTVTTHGHGPQTGCCCLPFPALASSTPVPIW